VTALSHAVVCRCRQLQGNQISTIANGAFVGLTALDRLYGAGLWGLVLSVGSRCLVFAWMWGPSPGFYEACCLLTMTFSPCYCLSDKLLFLSAHYCMLSTHRCILSCLLVFDYVCVFVCVCECVCVLVCFGVCSYVCARTRMWVLFDIMNGRMVKMPLLQTSTQTQPCATNQAGTKVEGLRNKLQGCSKMFSQSSRPYHHFQLEQTLARPVVTEMRW
jgi:hypothetical protein